MGDTPLDGFPVGMPRANIRSRAELREEPGCSLNTTIGAMGRNWIAFELKRLDRELREDGLGPMPRLAEFHQGMVDFNHQAREIYGNAPRSANLLRL